MKNIEVCTHGIYRTIGNVLGVSPSLACMSRKMQTNPRHEIAKAIYEDLIAAQFKVIKKYKKQGLI